MMKRFPFIYFLSIFFFCTSTLNAQQDGVDTTGEDLLAIYFQKGEKVKDANKLFLITKMRKTMSLSAYLNDPDKMYPDYILDDLDNDGKKELLITNYTGGAHCCDELFIFKNTGPNKYQQAAKLFGGHTTITNQKEFVFGFYEPFGYFFTCYACEYTDTTDEAPVEVRTITLQYKNGRLKPVPGDNELKNTITDNLGKLGEQSYMPLDKENDFDEGLRKEFAMNLAVYYFSFGKNLPATMQLFNKYYKFPDAKKVWTEFVKHIEYMKTDNDF